VRERLQRAEAEYAAGGAPAFEGATDGDRDAHRRLMQRLVEDALKEEVPDHSDFHEWWVECEERLQTYRLTHPRWHEGPPSAEHVAAAREIAERMASEPAVTA
jgi:hypothetical protein